MMTLDRVRAAVAIALAVLTVPAVVAAQRPGAVPELDEYRVVRWTTGEGLPQNTVNDMVLLPNGEFWLATFGGLARFDGDAFHVIDIASDEGMPANRVVALAPAGHDAFWFLTQQGHLGRVDAGQASYRVPPPTSARDSLSLFIDASGRIFSKVVDGSIWETDGTRPWRLVLAPAQSWGMMNAFASTNEGRLWAGWGDRIVDITGGVPATTIPVPSVEPDLFQRRDGGLWLGLQKGIGQVSNGRVSVVPVEPAIDEQVNAVAEVGEATLWIATHTGVSRLNRGGDGIWRRAALVLQPGLATDIRSLFVDGGGTVWVGTNGQGLFRLSRGMARRFGKASGLNGGTALATDGRGGAFVASACLGLFHLSPSGVSTPIALRSPHLARWSVRDQCALSLWPLQRGGVLVRAKAQLFNVSADARTVHALPFDLPDDEGPILGMADGSFWAISRSGIVRLMTMTGVVLRELRLAGPLVSASLAPDGSLWIGGDGRVLQIGKDGVHEYGEAAQVPRGIVRDVLPLPDGTVWIATYGGGIGRLRDGRVMRITVDNGLPDNAVSRILDDGLGRYWIATNRGLAVVDEGEINAVADHRTRMLPVVLGPERGVDEANFGSPAGFKDADANLWFGTIEGVARIDATAFPFNMTPPQVRIEGVWADERPIPLGDPVSIPPLAARVRVRFTTFGLSYPERLRFRFRVLGIDEAWVDAGPGRSVDWTPPGPGRHRFVVEARNEDGVWSTSPATIVFNVLPAWYQTVAVRAAFVATVALAGIGLLYAWRRRIERRHAERLRALEEQQAAQQRVASLRAQLEHVSRVALAGELAASIAHEVSQPLGAIVNNAEAGRRQLEGGARDSLELREILGDIVDDGMRASEVVRSLRGFLRRADDDAVAVDVSALVRQMLPIVRRELSESNVQVTLALEDGLPPVTGYPVQLGQVVVNLLMNACEALSGVDGERRVSIRTAAVTRGVTLAVRDNGPGLHPDVEANAFTPFVTTKPGGLGMGLAICRAIAESHGGVLRAGAALGGGLEVTLSLPVAAAKGHVA